MAKKQTKTVEEDETLDETEVVSDDESVGEEAKEAREKNDELTSEVITDLLDESDDDQGDEQEALATTDEKSTEETKEKGEEAPAEAKSEEKAADESEAPEEKAEEEAEKPEAKVEQQVEEKAPTPEPAAEEHTPAIQTAEEYDKWRNENIEKLAGRYKLSDEDVEALSTDPGEVIPKFGARLLFDAVQFTTQAIMANLPAAIEQVSASNRAAMEAEDQFYKAWGDLDKSNPDHLDTVRKLAASYRKLYPKASEDDVRKHVGAQAMIALKIAPSSSNGKGDEAEVVITPPPPPAAARGGSGPAKPKAPTNPFEALAEEFLEEDADLS